MKFNPTHRIKILKGSYKVANENDVLNEFKFYYQLKQLKIDGFFKRGELQSYSDVLGCSTATISRKLTKLRNVGFIRKVKGGFQLLSYDAFWERLGYDLSDSKNFQIIKVSSKIDFEWELYSKEIQISLKNQERKVIKNHIYKETDRNPDTENVPRNLQKALKRKFSHKIALRRNLQDIRKTLTLPEINYDITLSCQGVANLFGYVSSKQGSIIEKELQKRGLLKIVKRPALYISKDIDRNSFNILKKENEYNPVVSKLFMTERGIVMMKRCNFLEVDLECSKHHFNHLLRVHSTTKGGTCGRSTPPQERKEKETVYAYNNSIVNKNTNSSINIINKNSSNINSEHILNNSSNTSSILLGKLTVNEYLYHSKLKGYNSNIGNRVLHVRKADQYYINPITLRIGKIE